MLGRHCFHKVTTRDGNRPAAALISLDVTIASARRCAAGALVFDRPDQIHTCRYLGSSINDGGSAETVSML